MDCSAVEGMAVAERVASTAAAGFDGGEFSGPANDRAMHQAIDRLAQRYGIDTDDLWSVINEAQAMTEEEAAGYGDSPDEVTPVSVDAAPIKRDAGW